jgi:two-component system, cell cycle response regulator DivK
MSKRILVVEDQEDNRRILRDLLGNAGYELVEAETGEEALTAVEAQRPDLILMDIQLPVMNGYEAARRIKSNPDMKAVPIIAMTAYALAGDETKALAAGCNAYVSKPFSPRATREGEGISAVAFWRARRPEGFRNFENWSSDIPVSAPTNTGLPRQGRRVPKR